MSESTDKIQQLKDKRASAAIQVQTLGSFQVWVGGEQINTKEWGRDKTLQLFQFLITARHRRGLHKEQIIDRLWEELDSKSGEQTFKVALHGVNKVLEPNRKSRSEARFIKREGLAYQLALEEIWIDADVMEEFIAIANQLIHEDPVVARLAYQEAIQLHHGVYLPSRLYEDWSSGERERLQILALGTIITLANSCSKKLPSKASVWLSKPCS